MNGRYGELHQASKQGLPLSVDAPKRARYERPHATQVVEAPQEGAIALGGVVPTKPTRQSMEFSRHLIHCGPRTQGDRYTMSTATPLCRCAGTRHTCRVARRARWEGGGCQLLCTEGSTTARPLALRSGRKCLAHNPCMCPP